MTATVDMMLSLADAIENGNPNDIDGTFVLDAEQGSLIVQSLRNNGSSMQVDHDRSWRQTRNQSYMSTKIDW